MSDSQMYALMTTAELAFAMRAPGCAKGKAGFLIDFLRKRLKGNSLPADVSRLIRQRLPMDRPATFLHLWESYYRRLNDISAFLSSIDEMTDEQRIREVFRLFDDAQGPLTSLFGGEEFAIMPEQADRFDRYGLVSIHHDRLAQDFDAGMITSTTTIMFVGKRHDQMLAACATLQRYGFMLSANRHFRLSPGTNAITVQSSRFNPLAPHHVEAARQAIAA